MCKSCQAVRINGVLCHEKNCPDAWQDYTKECKFCGTEFKPEERNQEFCCEECYCNYWGYPYDNNDDL